MSKQTVIASLTEQRPDSWLQLAHEAGKLVQYHAGRSDIVKQRYDSPLAERSEVTLAERQRVARRILRVIVRDRINAQHIYLGASAGAFEHDAKPFTVAALPQRLEEARQTGSILQSFVKAAQLMVVARQLDEIMPAQAARWRAHADNRLMLANQKLFSGAPRLPLRPISILTMIGLEAHGLNRRDMATLQSNIQPMPGQG